LKAAASAAPQFGQLKRREFISLLGGGNHATTAIELARPSGYFIARDATGPLRLSCEFERLGGRLRSYAVGLEKSQVLKGCRQGPAARDVLSYPARFRTIQLYPKD
jgi:hypothetical protein